MEYAHASGGVDVIGLGCPMFVMTDAPKQLMDGSIDELPRYEDNLDIIPRWLSVSKRLRMCEVVNGFAAMFWFYEQLEQLGRTGKAQPGLTPFTCLRRVEARAQKILDERSAYCDQSGRSCRYRSEIFVCGYSLFSGQ